MTPLLNSKWGLAAPIAAFCIVWSFFHGLSYMQIVDGPHPYEQASRWIYRNVPAGAAILGVHWDDKLPIAVPGDSPHDHKYKLEDRKWELAVYELPDSIPKLDVLAGQLAQGDYLIFPTPRIPGSIPRDPKKYPYSTKLLQLIFAERIGYQMAGAFKKIRRVGPFKINDDLADESFTVYDNPKVVIFRNTGRLSAGDITSRVLNSTAYEPLPSLNEMMLMPLQRGAAAAGRTHSAVLDAIMWCLLVGLLGYLAFPVAAWAFPNAPDRGFGVARLLGILFFGQLCWLVPWGLPVSFEPEMCLAVLLVLGAAHMALLKLRRTSWKDLMAGSGKHILASEILFWGGFAVFALCRAFQPEIFWGEKPMDFAFLNYFVRLERFPVEDPWAAGHAMNYYYLGTYILAALHKTASINPAVGYNLAIATLAGLLLSSSFCVLLSLTGKKQTAVFGAMAVVLLSNFDVFYLAAFLRKAINFDLYWASSRTISSPLSPGINEYPLWSLLFADLHAHLIAWPFTGAILLFCSELLKKKDRPPSAVNSLLWGFLLGSLFGMNTWDVLTFGLLSGLAFFIACVRVLAGGRAPAALAANASLLALGAAAAALPFTLSMGGKLTFHYGWVTAHEFNNVGQILRHLGHWLLPAAAALIVLAGTRGAGKPSYWKIILSLFVGALPVFLGFCVVAQPWAALPWGILVLSAGLSTVAALLLMNTELKAAALFLLLGSSLIGLVELVFLMDRMNTIFKFYNSIWLFLGVAAISFFDLGVMPELNGGKSGLRKGAAAGAAALCACCAVIALVGSFINLQVMTTFRRVPGPRPTLDGVAYLRALDPNEASLVEWLNHHVTGTPCVLEAWGPSYGPYTRISMFTGLPTILGWEHHVRQRGAPAAEVARRRDDIRTIYSTPDIDRARSLLSKYKVKYIVVSALERSTYSREGLDKFEENRGIFEPLYSRGSSRVYRVRL